MEFIRTWALGLCISAITGAVVIALSPSGSFEKSIRIVVSVFIICTMILPFSDSGSDIFQDDLFVSDESLSQAEKLSQEAYRQSEEYLRSSVITLLGNNGIFCDDVIIKMNTADNAAVIQSITVVNPDADESKVKALIKDTLGVEVQVKNNEKD